MLDRTLQFIGLIIILLIPHFSFGETGVQQDLPDDNFFEAGLLTFTLLFLISMCLLTLIGIAIASLLLLMVFALIVAGIFSTSLIYALYKKSLSSFFKVAIITSCCFIGLLGGLFLFVFFNNILHWTTISTSMLVGSIVGTFAGCLTGLIIFRSVIVLTKKYVEKHPINP